VPDVSAFVQHIYQDGVPLLSNNNGVAGLKIEWKIFFDFGKRRDEVRARSGAGQCARKPETDEGRGRDGRREGVAQSEARGTDDAGGR
jgi:hypothetical protein